MKEVIVYDGNNGIDERVPFGADAENTDVTYDGEATDAKSAVEDIIERLDGIVEGTEITSGIVVDGVGELAIDMGNIKAGINVDGFSVSELLKAAYGEKNTFSILHLSDTHGGTACVNGCVSRANEDDEIGFILHTGDIVPGTYNRMLAVECDCPLLGILGNHDAWDTYKSESAAAAAIQALCGNNVVYGTEDTSYWYKDVTTEAGDHIRFIAVNEYDYSNADFSDTNKTPWIYQPVRTQRQMQWLCDLLYNTPSSCFIVFVTHQALQENVWSTPQDVEWVCNGKHGSSLDGRSWYAQVINAYLTHSVFSGTATVSYRSYFTLNFTYDFSSLTSNATFICHLCGHTHYDCHGYLSSYPNQLMSCITRADSVASEGGDDVDRSSVTWAADKVTFDLALRKVIIERIGSIALTGGGERTRISFDF